MVIFRISKATFHTRKGILLIRKMTLRVCKMTFHISKMIFHVRKTILLIRKMTLRVCKTTLRI